MSFHELIAHCFSGLNNVPLSECSSYFFHKPIEGNLVCFQVWGIMNKAAVNISVSILCGYTFSTHLGNTKEHDC